jgi:hypothetical protein
MARHQRDDGATHESFTHESRTEESRRLEAREMELREQFDMTANDPLWVDPRKIPHGWEYAWIKTALLDIPDFVREIQTKKIGFTPVPSDRHPELCTEGMLGQLKHNYIKYRGLMLCEIPKSVMDRRRKTQALQNFQITDQLQGLQSMMSDPHLPKMDFGSSVKRTVSFAE